MPKEKALAESPRDLKDSKLSGPACQSQAIGSEVPQQAFAFWPVNNGARREYSGQ